MLAATGVLDRCGTPQVPVELEGREGLKAGGPAPRKARGAMNGSPRGMIWLECSHLAPDRCSRGPEVSEQVYNRKHNPDEVERIIPRHDVFQQG
jgi:hypothetical protein